MNIKAALATYKDDMFRLTAANVWWITNVQPVHPNVRPVVHTERRNMQVETLLRYTVRMCISGFREEAYMNVYIYFSKLFFMYLWFI
jgi:hypothetical protein